MLTSAKRKLIVGATGLAVLAGGGGAYAAAAGQSPSTAKPPDVAAEKNAFLDDVAKRLNVTRDQLNAAIKGAAEARIDAAVAAGRLTKEQGDAAKRRLEKGVRIGPGLLGGAPRLGMPHGPGRLGFGFGLFGGLDGAADYLGLSDDELVEQLRDGKSLADVAKAQNKSIEGLKATLRSSVERRLDEAVKDGHLTAEREDKILQRFDERIDDVINATRPERPRLHWR